MRKPKVGIKPASLDEPGPLAVGWKRVSEPDALWTEDKFETPEVLNVEEEVTTRLVWRGEVWPKFTVVLTGVSTRQWSRPRRWAPPAPRRSSRTNSECGYSGGLNWLSQHPDR